MKKILIILPKLTDGGAEKVGSNLSFALSQKHQVYLVVFNDKIINYPHKGELIKLKPYTPLRPLNYPGKLFRLIDRVVQLKKIKKEKNVDVSISLLTYMNIVNILSRQKDKIITSIRSFSSVNLKNQGLDGKFLSFFSRLFYNRSDCIVSVSKLAAKDLTENFKIKPEKIKVIYNYVNPAQIRQKAGESPEEYEEVFNGPVIINVSRLHRQKGQKSLLKIFKEVKKQVPASRLVILGEGSLKQELISYARKLGLKVNSEVYFLGFQTNPYKFLSRAKVFALTSTLEGMPNAVLEAMACGLPIVSSDCRSGPREILAPDTDPAFETQEVEFAKYGVLMPVIRDGKDSEEKESLWVDVLVRFLTDKEQKDRYKRLSQDRARAFQEQSIIKEWESLL